LSQSRSDDPLAILHWGYLSGVCTERRSTK